MMEENPHDYSTTEDLKEVIALFKGLLELFDSHQRQLDMITSILTGRVKVDEGLKKLHEAALGKIGASKTGEGEDEDTF
jgi:hypothetical protein